MADDLNGLGTSPVVFATDPDFRKGLTTSLIPAVDIQKFVGTVVKLTEKDVPRRPERLELSLYLPSRAAIYTWESEFNGRRGRLKNFFVFTPFNEFVLKEAITSGSDFCKINYVGYENCYAAIDRLYMLLSSGDKVCHVVTNVVADSGKTEETISFSTSFDREIAPAEVVTFGRVLLGRFDVDSYQLSLDTDSVATVSGRFYELVQEYGDIA